MKKSFMNIKNFVDSNVRQRIDRASNNNNDFFGDDLLLVEKHFENIRHVCVEAEKRISALLQSSNSSNPLGAYTQNVQASLNNLSNLTTTTTTATTNSASTSTLSNVDHQSTTKQSNHEQSTSNAIPIQSQANSATSSSIVATTKDFFQEDDELRNDIRKHKKLPIVGFLKFLVKSRHKLKKDSLLATTLTHCSQLQTQLTKLYLAYEQTIELQCLKPIQQILENDIPNVLKLRKLFIKSHNDLESVKIKYNGVSQKQQSQQTTHFAGGKLYDFTSTSYTITQSNAHQANINKLDQLRKELDEAVIRFEQARDTYATELYSFVCRETELVGVFMRFYKHQIEYHQQVCRAIQKSLPTLSSALANTPRKVVFGTPLEEHLQSTGRSVSLVIELCVHLLHSNALSEEGLFRIPGSSVKIKKLKNAINAWFVTLASQSDFENHRLFAQSSVLAIHDLFKDIAGQRPLPQTTLVGDSFANNQATATVSTREDSTSAQVTNPATAVLPSTTTQDNQQTVFDVHTVAGLLKLYLRELPEPLFTYALYNQWISATVKKLNNDSQAMTLEQVIEQLPKANYDNLRLLIRFLNLLTCHQGSNRMTSTNLAITMAPSLIWAEPAGYQQSTNEQVVSSEQQLEDTRALNMQMSSVGMSASLHAYVIETLINNAEKLFPGQVQFMIPDLSKSSEEFGVRKKAHQFKHNRCLESTSPTGLSTASSSSFSSNGSGNSLNESKQRLKSEITDGLLLDDRTSGSVSSLKPSSGPDDIPKGSISQPPPVPPAPASRSHLRHASDSSSVGGGNLLTTVTHQKQPAPPVPTCALKRQQRVSGSTSNEQKSKNNTKDSDQNSTGIKSPVDQKPFTGSLRGTGSLRPTVPPPSRPPKPPVYDNQLEEEKLEGSRSTEDVDSVQQSDSKSSPSLISSSNFRGDFEEIQVADVEDIDLSVPSSSIVSLDSHSGTNDDDSSFDNDTHSLEQPWTESEPEQREQYQTDTGKCATLKPAHDQETKPAPMPRKRDTLEKEEEVVKQCASNKDEVPPTKPPRCISPKITQSTPL